MKKRVLSVLLCMALCVGLLPVTARAEVTPATFADLQAAARTSNTAITLSTSMDGGGGVVELAAGSAITVTGTVKLSNMTIQSASGYSTSSTKLTNNGTLRMENCTVTGNGKGLLNSSGHTAVLVNCAFRENVGTGRGGAIQTPGTLILDGCSFVGNVTSGDRGGAISAYDPDGAIYANNSIFYNNNAPTYGILYTNEGEIRLLNCTVVGNRGTSAAALYMNGSSYSAVNCLILDSENKNPSPNAGSLLTGTLSDVFGTDNPYTTVNNHSVQHTVALVNSGAGASQNGVATYFYCDEYGANLYMGYDNSGTNKEFAKLGSLIVMNQKVLSYLEGGTRQPGVIGASGVRAPSALTGLTYNGSPQTLATNNNISGVTWSTDGENFTNTNTIPTDTAAGSYDLWYKIGDGDAVKVTATIAPLEATLAWSNTALTYNGTEQAPTCTVSNLASGDTCAVTVSGAQANASDGTYTATATALSNTNYALPSAATQSFTVGKKEVTVTGITATVKEYDGTAAATLNYDDVSFEGKLENDTLTVTATGAFADASVGENKTVNISGLTLDGASAGNYTISGSSQSTTTASITAAALTVVSATGWSGTYDKAEHSITVTCTGTASDATVTYSETEDGTYRAANPTYTDAGTHTVYYKASKAGYADATGSATVEIAKKDITISGITANDKTFDGSAAATLAYTGVTYDGILAGDTLEVSATGAFADADAGTGKTVNITNLALGGTSAGNYQLAASGQQTSTTASIDKAAAQMLSDVTQSLPNNTASVSASVAGLMPANAGTLTYTAGTETHTGSVSVSAFTVGTDGAVSATLSGGAANDTITLPVTISSTNYADSTVNVKVTLVAKSDAGVTITEGTSLTKTYGDAAVTLHATATEGANGAWTWTSSNESVATVSSAGVVTIVGAGSANITASYESDTTVGSAVLALTVNKATPVVTAPTANTLTYTGEPQALVTAGSADGGTMQYRLGDGGEYSTTIPAAADTGNYTVWYKVVGDANHNDTAPASVAVTIIAIQVAAPVLPSAGSFTGSKSITITCATEGAKIYYTTDGSAPTSSSTRYAAAFSISATTTVKAIAVKEGCTGSDVASATYTRYTPSYSDSGSSSSSSSSTTTTPSTTATTTNADGSTTRSTSRTTTTRNSDGSTTAKTTETATTTAADGAKTEAKTETSTTTKTTNGTTTATTATTETSTTTAADGATTETTENRTVSTTTDASGAVSGTGTVSATAVTTAADGTTSTTVTEGVITVSTDEAGTVSTVTDATATTTDSEGNVTVTETVATEAVAKDGSTGETVVDKATEELISADIVISQQALDTAIETEEPIQAPVTIPVSTAAASDASPISVKIPAFESGRLPVPKLPTVELQVTRGGFGAVAVQKLVGGLLRVIKECRMGSVIVPVEGDCELVIVDNSRDFLDVGSNAWYKDSVDFVVSRTIFGGVSPQMFDPDTAMTRGMVAQVLYNFDRNAEAGIAQAFGDVKSSDWYADAVGWANENAIVGGYSSEWYGAADSITRQDLMTFLYRYAAFAGYDTSFTSTLADWTDADSVANYAKDAMDWALYNDIIGDIEGTLSPTTSATRAQVAAIMMRFVSNVR